MDDDHGGEPLSLSERLELARALRAADDDVGSRVPRLALAGALWLLTWSAATLGAVVAAALEVAGVRWWIAGVAGSVLVTSVVGLRFVAAALERRHRGR